MNKLIVVFASIASLLAIVLYAAGQVDFEFVVVVLLYDTFVVIAQIYSDMRKE